MAPLLEARATAGLVRRCHGDLHLRNICVIDGRPRLFDAIEFNESYSCIDVLYDLAFLIMDLEHRGLKEGANLLFNRYLERRSDIEGLAALPLFLSVRAGVRAKITFAMAKAQPDPEAARNLLREGQVYFAAADDYLLPVAPRLVAVGGLSGSGKSRLARALAPGFGAPPGALVLRSDVLRKRRFDQAPEAPLGPEAYRPEVSRAVYDDLAENAATALAAGRSVIADAVFARPEERRAIAALAAKLKVPFQGLWLEASRPVLLERVGARRKDASDADAAIVERQLDYDLGAIDWQRLDAGGTPEAVAAAARALLSAA
jgi:predicted kinase